MSKLNDYLNDKKSSQEHIKHNPSNDRALPNLKLDNKSMLDFAASNRSAGQDTTNDDYIDSNYLYSHGVYDTDQLRAEKQSWGSKAGRGVVQFAAKTGLEATKTLGVLGGLAASPFSQGEWTDTAFNNGFIKALENAEEWVDNEMVPVYVKEAVQNGNLWDKISSIDFWSTEGADGLGFIAAMFAPGVALKSLNIGKGLAQTGVAANKAFSKLVGRSGYIDDAVEKLNQGGKWFGTNANKLDVQTTSIFNTLSEAGIEAGHGMKDFQDKILEQYKNGEITYEEYNKKSEKKGEVGRNIFLSNIAVLTVPNYINSNLLYGKRGGKDVLDLSKKIQKRKIAEPLTGATTKLGKLKQGTQNIYNKYKVGNLKRIADSYGNAFVREGLIEEGGQNTITEYFSKKGEGKQTDFIQEYLSTIGSTEGQVAMFLGTAFGGTMQSVQNVKNNKKADERYNALADYVNDNIDAFNTVLSNDIYQKDKDGKIIYETDELGNSKPKLDIEKVLKSTGDKNQHHIIAIQLRNLIEEGRTEEAEDVLDRITTSLIAPFALEEDLGIETLKDFLKSSDALNQFAELKQISKKSAINEFVKKAENLKKASSNYNNYSDTIIDFTKFRGNLSEKEMQDLKQKTQSTYINIKARQDFLQKKEEQINNELDRIKREKEIESDEQLEKSEDTRVKELLNQRKELKDALKENKNAAEAIWDGKTLDKLYKNMQKNKKSKEEMEKESVKADEVIDKIQKATSDKDLDELTKEEIEKFNHDVALIDEISESIKKDFSKKNLKFQLKKLKSYIGKLPQENSVLHNVEKSFNPDLKYNESGKKLQFFDAKMVERILKEQIDEIESKKEEFISVMDQIIDKLNKRSKNVKEKLEAAKQELEREIEVFMTASQAFKNASEGLPTKGRNAKINRELIEEDKKRLLNLRKNIVELETRVKELTKQKKDTDEKLAALDSVFEDILRKEFVGFNDFKDFLFENLNYLEGISEGQYSEMDALSLATSKLYIDEELQNSKKAIEELNETVEFLEMLQKEQEELNKKQSNKNKKIAQYTLKINEAKSKVKQLEERIEELNYKKEQIEARESVKDLKILINNLKDFRDFNDSSANIIKNNSYIKRVFRDRKNRIAGKVAEKNEKAKKQSEEDRFRSENELSEAITLFNKFKKLKKGDTLTLPKRLFPNIQKTEYLDTLVEFVKVTSSGGIGVKLPGEDAVMYINPPSKPSENPKLNKGTKSVHSTEGGTTGQLEEKTAQELLNDISEIEGSVTAEANSRLGITKGDGETTLFDIPESSLDYERNGENKTNHYHSISIMEAEDITAKSANATKIKKAIKEYNTNGVTSNNIAQLIDYLPIKVNLTDSSFGVIFSKPSENKGTYGNTSKNLRRRIMQELLAGKSVSDINVRIAGQKNGQINIAPKKDGKVVENSLLDLHEVGKDFKNLNSQDFYIVNENGMLVNSKGKYFKGAVRRELSPGELYLDLKMPSGKNFPLKLNVQRINETQAEALYELYKYRLREGVDKSVLFEEIPTEINKKVKDLLGSELTDLANLLGETKQRLTLKDIIDFYIWDGTTNKKSKVNVSKKNNAIYIGTKKITKDKLEDDVSKETFIDFMTNRENNNEGKRRHIQFKKGKGNRKLNFENRDYVKYLVNKKLINTNVNTNERTFIGDTSIYLDNNIFIGKNNKASSFNEKRVIKAKRGTRKDLKKIKPELSEKKLTLNELKNLYYDRELKETKGDRDRVSNIYYSAKDETPPGTEEATYMGAKRGDVIDDLVRVFFEERLSYEQFLDFSKKAIKNANETKKKYKQVDFTEEAIDSLYNILIEYDNFFAEKDYTIFSFENTLWNDKKFGNLGKTKGYFAGTTDLLAYDNKNDKWIIIDVKSASVNLQDLYDGKLEDSYNTKQRHQFQQNAYAEMFEQITGEKPKLFIMPLQVRKPSLISKDTYKYGSVKRSDKMLLPVDSSKSIYELIGIKKPKTKAQTTKKEVVTSNKKKNTTPSATISNNFFSTKEKEELNTIVSTLFKSMQNTAPYTPFIIDKEAKATDYNEIRKNYEIKLIKNKPKDKTDSGNTSYFDIPILLKYKNNYVVYVVDENKNVKLIVNGEDIRNEINKRQEGSLNFGKISKEAIDNIAEHNKNLNIQESTEPKNQKNTKRVEKNSKKIRNSEENFVPLQEEYDTSYEEEGKEITKEEFEANKKVKKVYSNNKKAPKEKAVEVNDYTNAKEMTEDDYKQAYKKLYKQYIKTFRQIPTIRKEIMNKFDENPKEGFIKLVNHLRERENITNEDIKNICKIR